ncbi:amine oxidase [flavin-containing] A-like, partial [Mustelus asterias]
MLWGIKSGHGIERISNITAGAQERKFIGGAQTISERLAEVIGSDRVRLRSPVVRVEQEADSVTVTSAGGETVQGQFAISAVPHAILQKIHFEPPLPAVKNQLIQRMPMGSVIKTVTFYQRAFWKERGLSGCSISDTGPVIFSIDDTKPDGSHPAIMGFIQADTARRMSLDTPEQRKEAVCKHYAKIFKMKEFLDVSSTDPHRASLPLTECPQPPQTLPRPPEVNPTPPRYPERINKIGTLERSRATEIRIRR